MSNHSPRLDYREKEFPMTNKDFQRIADLAGRYTGIVLGEHKQDMVYGRIARRVRKLHLMSFTAYLDFLEENLEKELSNFINVITTNLTSFFREKHHLQNRILYPCSKHRESLRRPSDHACEYQNPRL